MTLDEAIKHAEDVADTCEYEASKYDMSDSYERHVACKEGECVAEHRQLAEWLKELKWLREQPRWIPCSERLPKDAYTRDFLVTVKFDNSKPIVIMCTWGRFCNGYNDDGYQDAFSAPKKCVINGATYWITQPVPMDKVVAWMPIPKGYQEGGQE